MKTNLENLLEFPCSFTYKIFGAADPLLVDDALMVIQKHAPGEYSPEVKKSGKGNYHSVSITIIATSIEQVEILYAELGALERVKMVM